MLRLTGTPCFAAVVILFFMACHSESRKDAVQSESDSARSSTGSQSPYTFFTPPTWNSEMHFFPLDFAPEISFQGYADVRFPPGWIDTRSDEFCAYPAL
jgi:hypothetical protein